MIEVESLVKRFRVPVARTKQGWLNSIQEVLLRKWQEVEVLKGLSFHVKPGEFVGFIGPNGAGKSTSLKCLTGILCPDGGSVRCAGFDPYAQRYNYTYHMGAVFGQKSILEYEVPVKASFRLYKEIYEIAQGDYDSRLKEFTELLGLGEYWDIPVRKLSFGQRMRCEVAASLLHRPKIVFLDEPTIGLDATAKSEIRRFLQEVNRREGTTILLTTHDMSDIESLCRRVILIDRGELIYDGALQELRQRYQREKLLRFRIKGVRDAELFARLKQRVNHHDQREGYETWSLRLADEELNAFVSELLAAVQLQDLRLEDEELEDVIRHIYADLKTESDR